jgi:hypothetical protein
LAENTSQVIKKTASIYMVKNKLTSVCIAHPVKKIFEGFLL